MDRVLHDFVRALRSSGVRVSVSEVLDAIHAARLTGYENREILKDALSATMAKTLYEKESFASCFDQFFSLDPFSAPDKVHLERLSDSPSHEEDSPLSQMLLSGDNAGLSMTMRQAAIEVSPSDIRFFTQKGLYVQRIIQGMGAEGLYRDIQRLSRAGSVSSIQKAARLKAAKTLFTEHVRDFVEQQYSLYAAYATEEVIERYLRHMRLSNLEQRDFARMHIIIQRMVKRLNDRHAIKKRPARRGSLDLKKTLRENIGHQGILFDTRWKRKKVDRPEIVVLCDVSRSVETVSRFMLLFLYGLNEAVVRIKSFIFCSNLVQVSHIFGQFDVEGALARLQKGVGLGLSLGRTDYGQVFQDLKENWLGFLTPKTTLLILGDARNNYGNPETGIINLIHKRTKRLIWLNPEPPHFWGTGDSEMKRYLPYCSLARECSTVNHLERIVGYLLKTH